MANSYARLVFESILSYQVTIIRSRILPTQKRFGFSALYSWGIRQISILDAIEY